MREGNFVTELKIGFLDLVRAESRGRWWGQLLLGSWLGEGRRRRMTPKMLCLCKRSPGQLRSLLVSGWSQ